MLGTLAKGCCSLVEVTNRPTGLHMYCGGRVACISRHVLLPRLCTSTWYFPVRGRRIVVGISRRRPDNRIEGSAEHFSGTVSLELRRDNPRGIHKRLRQYVRAGPRPHANPRAGGDHSTATTQGVVQVRRPCTGDSSAFYIGIYIISSKSSHGGGRWTNQTGIDVGLNAHTTTKIKSWRCLDHENALRFP
jgi:hypothetical protein